ncbi:MetQ/NlpA family ABC transporter substrate-binding protein [Dolosigranulum pigrum]|uniref:YaeC family lipoprotein n=1 Tax=Dolosigranulum pigrum ATCC 51524 TaxID=883103 RepID=H3NCJ0_9LACT|nr:MetQ/NlpA family ABC transporter substrate-binding protein [Dolosigranulum pigrum]EHR34866.1 YaeC family lipoprotein [Dolosigranulum pigrum ATCC 51524]
MKHMKTLLKASLLFLVAFIMVACTSQDAGSKDTDTTTQDDTAQETTTDSGEPTVIKVGMANELTKATWDDVGKRLLEKENIKVETQVFSDFSTPNRALSDGDIDLNAYQYISFLAQYNQDADTELRPIGYAYLPPLAMFAKEGIESIDDIPEGAKISFTEDPTNTDNTLLQLEKMGLIEVEHKPGERLTIDDVTENPKNLEFVPLASPEVVRSLLTGDVDLMITGLSMSTDGGLDPEDALYIEDPADTPYYYKVMIVSQEDRVDDEILQKAVAEFQSEETRQFVEENFGQSYLPAWTEGETPLEDYDKYVEEFMKH